MSSTRSLINIFCLAVLKFKRSIIWRCFFPFFFVGMRKLFFFVRLSLLSLVDRRCCCFLVQWFRSPFVLILLVFHSFLYINLFVVSSRKIHYICLFRSFDFIFRRSCFSFVVASLAIWTVSDAFTFNLNFYRLKCQTVQTAKYIAM